jgi:hypothetical protein
MANPSVEEKIKAAAAAKGIPADLAMRMASAESRYSPNVTNPRSTAGGLFQIIDDTWKRYGGAPGKKYDVDENIRVGTDIIADNQGKMGKLLSRQPTYGEIYAAHYFGPDKAKAVINAAPDTLASTILSAKVLRANPNLKDRTTAEIMTMLDRKMSPTGKSYPPAPRGPAASEFAAPGRPDPILLTQNTQSLPNIPRETMLAALGPNYQAAMALSYLSGNTSEDDSDLETAKDRIAADKESARSPGAEWLMQERRPSPFAGLDLTSSTPFAEPVARMAKGGEVSKDKDKDEDEDAKFFFEEKSAKQRLDEMQNSPDKGPYVGSELMPRSSRLQLQGEIANDTYGGIGGGGRATYTYPIGSEAAVRAYMEGGGYKPKDRNYKGQVNNMGISYGMEFSDGGAVHRAEGTPPEGETGYSQETAGAANKKAPTIEEQFLGNPNQFTKDRANQLYPKHETMNPFVKTAKEKLDAFNALIDRGISVKNLVGSLTSAIPFVGPALNKDLENATVNLPMGFERSPTNNQVVTGLKDTAPVKVADILDKMKTSELIGGKGASNVLNSVGKGYMPNPLDVVDAATLAFPAYGATKKIGGKAASMLSDLKQSGNAIISATGEKMGNAILNKMDKMVEAKRQRLTEKAATRPLTPRETRSLQLIEADTRNATGIPGIFTVGEMTEPGLLGQAIADQNIARVHGPAAPAAPAVPEITPVAPPVDVRVPAAAPEALPPPPAEVNIPPEMAAPPGQNPPGWQTVQTAVAPPDLVSVGQPANAPFVGRLDTFVQSLKGPVTLGQLKGQLKGKFRDYDLARVDEAFKGMDPNTKLKPAQITSALENTYSPSKWVSQTLPPEQGKYWGGMDNIWDQPLGTTNLYLAQAPEKVAAHRQALEITNNLIPFASSSAVIPSVTNLENTRNILRSDLVKNSVNPEHVNELLAKLDRVEPRVQELDKNQQLIENLKYGIMYPSIYNDAEFIAKIKASDPSAIYISTPHSYFLHKKIAELKAQGVTDFDQRWDTAFNYASKEVHNIVSNKMEAAGLGRPDFSGINYADSQKMSSQPVAINLMDTVVEPLLSQNRLDFNAIKKYTGDSTRKVAADLEKTRLYEGKHKSVAGEPYPIGFTRFSEHEANIGGQTLQGRHFHEIQSDLSKDVRKQGSSKGSKAADQAEYDGLQEKLNQIKTSMRDEITKAEDARQAGQDPAPYHTAAETIGKSLPALESRVRTLDNRMRNTEASYSLQEPFAGFETNSNVRSQLLMKNAIYSAMKDGKNFATFPGAESAQAQLYEGKVMPNLKQIAKDLGGDKAGISVTPIQLPPATKGNAPGVPVTAWGITWSPEAAARITKTGMPFAKGGMVERQPDDNRRYL